MTFEPVIGLEVHAQLKTRSKLFCGCSTEFGAPPNTQICPICAGYPGVLPVLNEEAVRLIVKTGLAVHGTIARHSIFARKQYFYPDLPKNYQISQYEDPIVQDGHLEISATRRIGIQRIHLEEDAGKLLHAIGSRELSYSLVDLNRTGIPLMEIVSQPDMRSPEEAYAYLTALKATLQYLEVSDCDMEKGSLRCDVNVSLRPVGHTKLGTKVEVKNLNSFKAVKEALAYEIERQMHVLNTEGRIALETRLWDAQRGVTEPMRSKEEAHDYRYFPEPDLVPLDLPDSWIEKIQAEIPELPAAKRARFIQQYALSDYDAGVLTSDKALADYFETAIARSGSDGKASEAAKPIANWITTELLGRLNTQNKAIQESPISPVHIAELVSLIQKGTISGKIAKEVFNEMFASGVPPSQIVQEKGLVQMSDESALAKLCDEALQENPKAVEEYRAGKERALSALVGAVMKKSQGKANPQLVNQIFKERLRSKTH